MLARIAAVVGVGCFLAMIVSIAPVVIRRVDRQPYRPPAHCDGDGYDQFVCEYGPPDRAGIDRSGRLAEELAHRRVGGRGVPVRWIVYKRAKLRFFFLPTDSRPSKSLPVRCGRHQLGWALSAWRDLETGADMSAREMAIRMVLANEGL
jgi:hypothetical protein